MTPLVIGIAGGSGSGKTTVVQRTMQTLGAARVCVLDHDRYYRHRPELSPETRAALNYDHPDALETPLLVDHLAALRRGETIQAPVYDFTRHERRPESETVAPRPAILVEGILVFADAALRAALDIKVYVDTADDLRFIRRLRRDVRDRGRSVDGVIDQYLSTVRPMHLEFVEPSKRYADVIVPEGGYNEVALDLLMAAIADRARARPE